jgi:putative endonuclease
MEKEVAMPSCHEFDQCGLYGEEAAGEPRPKRKPVLEMTKKELGEEGEKLAAVYFRTRHYELIDKNWRCKFGEVDLVCRDPQSGETVLVEVKTRLGLGSDPYIIPELSVTEKKQQKYRKLGLYYMACHPETLNVRFDVVAITIVSQETAKLRHLLGAFVWDE